MNLKSKAISEIRETIETLNAHTECTDRIEGLQVLLGELEAPEAISQMQPEWVACSDQLPPVGVMVLMRGVITWKSKDQVSYFSDVMSDDYEILEYGATGYTLKYNNDYLAVNHPHAPDVCDEYISHWMPLPQPPTK